MPHTATHFLAAWPAGITPIGNTPLWQTLILDRPWIGALIAIALAIIVAASAHRAGKATLAKGAIGVGILLGIAIMAVGNLVTTPEAMLRERTTRFVNAIATAQSDELETMLAPRLVIASQGVSNLELSSDWLIGIAANMDRAVRSNDTTILSVELQSTNTARVTFRCRTALTEYPQTVGSTWEVQWQRFDGTGSEAWKVVRFEAQTILGQDAGRRWIEWANRYRSPR